MRSHILSGFGAAFVVFTIMLGCNLNPISDSNATVASADTIVVKDTLYIEVGAQKKVYEVEGSGTDSEFEIVLTGLEDIDFTRPENMPSIQVFYILDCSRTIDPCTDHDWRLFAKSNIFAPAAVTAFYPETRRVKLFSSYEMGIKKVRFVVTYTK